MLGLVVWTVGARRTGRPLDPDAREASVLGDFNVSLHGASTFFVTGELDIAAAPIFGDTIRAAVARGGPLTLDLSRTTFIDSAGVHAILKAVADLPSGCLILHGVHDGMQRILNMVGIGGVPNLHIIACQKELERDHSAVELVETPTLGARGARR
jgi:anti-anti-sigma factor